VPPSVYLTDSFDSYTAGSFLDTATSSRWVLYAGTTGHWDVVSAGCLSGHCIEGAYNTTGQQPDAYIAAPGGTGALGGSISFYVKWDGTYFGGYSTQLAQVGYFDGTSITSSYGVTAQDGTTGMSLGGTEYTFDNLTLNAWHFVQLFWVADPNAGVRISLSVDNSLPQDIISDPTATNSFALNGANAVIFEDYGHGSNTYIDSLNAQLLDVQAIQTIDYTGISTTTCSITNVTGCFQNALSWAFVPPAGAFNGIQGLWAQIDQKPPFGYFTVGLNEVNGINASTTGAFSLESIDGINEYIFHPIDVALAGIWWGIFAIWFFFHRLRHIDI